MTSLSTRMVTALKTAIRRERTTALVYEQKARLATEEKVKAVLTSLAKQETNHARKLERVLEKKDISSLGAKKSSPSPGSLSLKNDDIRKLGAQTETARVLTWAIKAEENSFKFYTSLSKISKGLDVAELFSRLAEEELKHKERLETVLARL